MGKYVADMIIRALLEYLMRNYKLELDEKDGKWKGCGKLDYAAGYVDTV